MSGLSALAQTFEANSKQQASATAQAVQSALDQHEQTLIEQLKSSELTLSDAIQLRERNLREQMELSELEQREQAILTALQSSEKGLIEAINRRENSISERLRVAEQRALSLAVTTWKWLGASLIVVALVASGALWWTGQQIADNLAVLSKARTLGVTFHEQEGAQYIILPPGSKATPAGALKGRTAMKLEK